MLTYKEAKRLVENNRGSYDYCDEYEDAYFFYNEEKGLGSIGGFGSPLFVFKENGRFANHIIYLSETKTKITENGFIPIRKHIERNN